MRQRYAWKQAPIARNLTTREFTVVTALDVQRRLLLLRFIVPGLLILLVISILGIVFSNSGVSPSSVVQWGVGLSTLGIGLWATLTRRVNVASLALLIGITLRSMAVILFDGPIAGAIKPATMSDFFLLLLPIIIAGVFTAPRVVAMTTGICLLFTSSVLLFVPMSTELHQDLRDPSNAVLIVLPLVIPILIGFLMFVGTQGFRRVQDELAELHIAYEREKELERLRELFISNVNHELRTPIMALQGYLALAEELGERGEAADQHAMIQEGRRVAKDLGQLVKTVLNVRQTKMDMLVIAPSEFSLYHVVLDTLVQLERWNIQQGQREIQVDIPEDALVFADEQRVQEVLANLLSNAMKYSAQTTPIAIAARVIESAGKHRGGLSSVAAPAEQIEVAIRDYGLGIPPDQVSLLFEPFVRLERDITSTVQGTGLGLAICRTYLRAMGGDIVAESSGVPGEGSTFRFTLPLAAPAPITALT